MCIVFFLDDIKLINDSPAIDEDDSDEDMYVKPAKKKKPAGDSTEYFGKAGPATKKAGVVPRKISQSMKPASPPKAKKGKKAEESDDMMDYDDLPKPPARSTAPARAARGAVKKYVEIMSDDDEE